MKQNHFILFSLFLIMQACVIKNAKAPKSEFVHVYTDVNTLQDKQIYRSFLKKSKIKVIVSIIAPDTLLNFLKMNKYNAKVDLFILSGNNLMQKLSGKKFLFPVKSDILEENIDPIYRSKYNNWFAISKTALVVAYNQKVLKKDTIRNYRDLNDEKWKGKIAFQSFDYITQESFRKNIKELLGNKTPLYLEKFFSQRVGAFVKNDAEALMKVRNLESQLALVQLSSIAKFQDDSKNGKNRFDVQPNFPNQSKKGSYLKVSSAGVYRYAENSSQAKLLLEYLTSKEAQYLFAASRYEAPIVKGVKSHYLLDGYRKFRGRFYTGKKH